MGSCQNKAQKEQNKSEIHELLTVTAQDYTLNEEYPASIHGAQDIKIIPRVEGHLMGVYVKEGERVREGQLLFRLDDAPSRAAVAAADANVQMMTAALDKAQLEYNGKKNLRQKSVVSDFELSLAESDLNVAKANLAAAKASLTSARNDLRYTEIRSPSNGVVGRIFYRKGDLVGPSIQDGLTVVADNRQMRVYFSMTEKTVMQYLSEHQSMEATIQQMPELRLQLPDGTLYEHTGRVESISGVVDERTGAVSFATSKGKSLLREKGCTFEQRTTGADAGAYAHPYAHHRGDLSSHYRRAHRLGHHTAHGGGQYPGAYPHLRAGDARAHGDRGSPRAGGGDDAGDHTGTRCDPGARHYARSHPGARAYAHTHTRSQRHHQSQAAAGTDGRAGRPRVVYQRREVLP